MRIQHRGINRWRWVLGAPLLLLLGACGSATSTPTLAVDAIFTSAAQTFAAQQAAQRALTPPTGTPSPTLFPTLPVLSPISTLSFASPTLGSGGSSCDNSAYVADVTIPDGTTITAGKSFVKKWKLLNSGSCTWDASYKLVFDSGEQMSGATTFVTVPVPPGNQIEIAVNLTAPTSNGSYWGKWRMQNASSQPFGSFITVVIKVGSGAAATSASGMVTISGNAGKDGATIDYAGTGSHESGQTSADSNGDYSFTVPSGWSGTVTPSKGNKGAWTFDPANRPYNKVTSDMSGQNYTAQ